VNCEKLSAGVAQAIVLNSGNANCGTGKLGLENARKMAQMAAKALGLDEELTLVASTGLIGVQLPMERIEMGIGEAARLLSRRGGDDAAKAIMTTDTVPKQAAVEFRLSFGKARLGGMAKGAGMIAPQMATMLCVLTTDVSMERERLQAALRGAVASSFNCITVDGDTSTNDMVLLLANGAAGELKKKADIARFEQALHEVCRRLALAIVSDAEGATKLIRVAVQGAASEQQARMAARTIANSLLVKTALFGSDPNWGRVLAALGRSGAEFDPAKLDIDMAGTPMMRRGEPVDFDRKAARRNAKRKQVEIAVRLNAGAATSEMWTCDISYDYVRLNAEYET
jgi:glutamate N-acetyltransferase/amino-acid N-acetyltransferase